MVVSLCRLGCGTIGAVKVERKVGGVVLSGFCSSRVMEISVFGVWC